MDKLIFLIPVFYAILGNIAVNFLNTMSIQNKVSSLYLWFKHYQFILPLTFLSAIFFMLYFVKGSQSGMSYVTLTLLGTGIGLLSAMLFSYFKMGEVISWQQLVGVGFVMIGVYITTLK